MMENLGSYSSITITECENFLDVIQKEFELRQKDHEHLSKIQEEVAELTTQKKILSKRKEFNEKCCILCCSSFNLLFRRRIQCHDCNFWVCRSCVSWENQHKIWICAACEKQRYLDAESWAWFYSRLKLKFSRFGDAKVLENICQKRKSSDSENDSGYGPSCDFKPFLSLFPSSSKYSVNMSDSPSHGDCEDDEEIGEEEEEAEIHHSIETIVEGLLGSALDDASVDRVYVNSPHYERIFSTFHNQLVDAVQNLSNSLRRALHNLPHDHNMSPTIAHVALKRLIVALVEECSSLPYLQLPVDNKSHGETSSLMLVDVDIFSSYEGLVASAIINKVVEDNQAKYLKLSETSSLTASCVEETKNYSKQNEDNVVGGEEDNNANHSFTEDELPLECIQVEEVEEITREYTDSEDDKYSSVSHQSSGLQSIDELGMQRNGSELDLLYAMESQTDGKIPFPEFGPDLVDDIEKIEDNVVCHQVAVASWEENWLFRKKRRLPLYSNLKYQLLTYCDEPPCMLIPLPSENSDTIEPDESSSSELSESHSVGSLEFSSDNEIQKSDESQKTIKPVVLSKTQHNFGDLYREPSSMLQVSDKTVSVVDGKSKQNVQEYYQQEETNVTDMKDCENSEVCCSNSNFRRDTYLDSERDDLSFSEVEGLNGKLLKPQDSSADVEITSHKNEVSCAEFETQERIESGTEENILQVPPQPGTIAEREHKKWLNAIPLKNNPYSAENISRRNTTLHKPVILNQVVSFEEFEQKLKGQPHSTNKEPLQMKLNCGLKSINGNLYKRDYYVNHFHLNCHEEDNNYFTSLPNFDSINSENCEGIPEEALNSLEEKVYISAGKVFTLENHVKRLERELKDMCLSPVEGHSLPPSLNHNTDMVAKDVKTNSDYQYSSDVDENINLPSVRVLATKFSPLNPEIKVNIAQEKVLLQKSDKREKIKKTRPCMKVHSLTARSLSREFRDRARQNIPKPMNRLLSVPSQANEETTSEHESLCSPISAPSPVQISQNELTHGYTSDESSTSTSSLPRLKSRKHISRSILQRASYWERRAEQGLLSDASVSEEFPGLPVNPD